MAIIQSMDIWQDIKLTGDILSQSAARLGSKTAIICGDVRLSYAELEAAANQTANAFQNLDMAKGAKISIMARNVPEYAVSYFGAARSGHVLVHVSTRYTADELSFVLNKSDSETLIVEAAFADIAQAALKDCPAVRHLIVVADFEGAHPVPDGIKSFADLIAAEEATAPNVDIRETDLFSITFTGGTTGFPKGAAVDHRARLISSLVSVREEYILEGDIAAVTTPLFHTAGLFVWYQATVLVGATSVLIPQWSPAAFFDAVRDHGVTGAFMVPTQIIMLLNDDNFDKEIFARLKRISYGGAPMPPAVLDDLQDRFSDLRVFSNYGQTEACPLASALTNSAPAHNAALGKIPSGIEVAVLSPEGEPVEPGVIGEIASRGPHVMRGYYNDAEQTAAYFRNGWGLTGDLGVMDEGGFLKLVDRTKDMVISGGENIYPKEIENVLHRHSAVAECAVFGVPDKTWGEAIAAHVCLRNGEVADSVELLAFCAANLAHFKLPKMLLVVDELPKTAIGKIQKNVLRDRYSEGLPVS
jgi:fatty-acyl-CoA synthase